MLDVDSLRLSGEVHSNVLPLRFKATGHSVLSSEVTAGLEEPKTLFSNSDGNVKRQVSKCSH